MMAQDSWVVKITIDHMAEIHKVAFAASPNGYMVIVTCSCGFSSVGMNKTDAQRVGRMHIEVERAKESKSG